MSTVDLILGIALLVFALFLIIAVLMQQGKSKNLSGTIAGGGSETFYGKSKGMSKDKKLSRLTTVISIIFVGIVLAVYLMQDASSTAGNKEDTDFKEVTTKVEETVKDEEKKDDAADKKDEAADKE